MNRGEATNFKDRVSQKLPKSFCHIYLDNKGLYSKNNLKKKKLLMKLNILPQGTKKLSGMPMTNFIIRVITDYSALHSAYISR